MTKNNERGVLMMPAQGKKLKRFLEAEYAKRSEIVNESHVEPVESSKIVNAICVGKKIYKKPNRRWPGFNICKVIALLFCIPYCYNFFQVILAVFKLA